MQWSSRQKAFFFGGGGLLLQDMARKCTSNRTTQTTAQRHERRHLSATLSVYATSLLCPLFYPFTPCSKPLLPSQAGLRKSNIRCTTLSTEEWWAHTEACHFLWTINATKTSSSCSPWRQSVQRLINSVSCSLSLLSLTSVFIAWISIPMPLSKPFSWLMRLDGHVALRGWGGRGGPVSAGSHWPQAAVSQAGSLGSIFSERS